MKIPDRTYPVFSPATFISHPPIKKIKHESVINEKINGRSIVPTASSFLL